MKNTRILTVNAGSSSLKLSIFSVGDSESRRELDLAISDIGQPASKIHVEIAGNAQPERQEHIPHQTSAITKALAILHEHHAVDNLGAVGHRLVHGGPDYHEPQVVTAELLRGLEQLTSLDSEHLPAALELINALKHLLPDIPNVVCFDTAFFSNLPRLAQIVPLARRYEKLGVRRYGFHGLSYTYLLQEFERIAGSDAAHGRIVLAHLGSGASLAAVHNGKPVDTTMGFSPASGIMMSTRSGDLDPNLVGYLHHRDGLSLTDFEKMVNTESGLLGVSGLTADMRTLIAQETTNEAAAEAVALFCYNVRKAIGSLTATLGGLDSLIFSGGIGEQADGLRMRICSDLGYLGIELDEPRNRQHAACISSSASRVGVHVIPTDEAAVICQQTLAHVDTGADTHA